LLAISSTGREALSYSATSRWISSFIAGRPSRDCHETSGWSQPHDADAVARGFGGEHIELSRQQAQRNRMPRPLQLVLSAVGECIHEFVAPQIILHVAATLLSGFSMSRTFSRGCA
jgi:hypothetical protein